MHTSSSTLCRSYQNTEQNRQVHYFTKSVIFFSDLTSSKEKGAAIFNSPSSANAFLVRKRNNPQGIVCECCVHHCTSNEFAEYCEAPSKRRKRSILKMNNAVLSHEENYHLSSEALDDEVEAFYREVDEIAQSDAPIPFVDFHRFSNKPVIRLLEQQKLNNIHRTFAMKDGDDFESKYLNLKAYFRQRLTQMLSVVGKEAPSGHSKINTTTTPAPTQEKAPVGDLQALIQLFKTEANNS